MSISYNYTNNSLKHAQDADQYENGALFALMIIAIKKFTIVLIINLSHDCYIFTLISNKNIFIFIQ